MCSLHQLLMQRTATGKCGQIDFQRFGRHAGSDGIFPSFLAECQMAAQHAQQHQIQRLLIAAFSSDAQRIRDRIRAMGPVNVAAIEEYAQMNERYTQLSDQKRDLEKAGDFVTVRGLGYKAVKKV